MHWLTMHLEHDEEVSEERRRRALSMLESWLVRRALMRLTAKNYNRLVSRLVAKIKADLEHADEALLSALAGGEGEISRWPGDEEFKDFLCSRDAYGMVSRPRLVTALAAVQAGRPYSTKTEVPELTAGLSLEHLIPQDWEDHWPLTDTVDRSKARPSSRPWPHGKHAYTASGTSRSLVAAQLGGITLAMDDEAAEQQAHSPILNVALVVGSRPEVGGLPPCP